VTAPDRGPHRLDDHHFAPTELAVAVTRRHLRFLLKVV
jgi:hypothetical protein